jgi:1-acyl-sn-glycerol-3-phosphate acyltransferase
MGYILGSIRLFLIFLIAGILIGGYSLLTLFITHTEKRGFKLRRIILFLLMYILGFRIKKEGIPEIRPALYVCNHKGVFDFFVVLRFLNAFIVSKSEMRKIPVISQGAAYTGIIYVTRENKESRSAVRDLIRQTLETGHNILIFPEGTTHGGRTTLEFKMGSFVEAAKIGIPVVPIALEYKNPRDYYVDIPALKMYFRSFGKLWTHCSISYGNAIHETDPEILCQKTKSWIDNKLLEKQHDFGHKYD